jgi:DNA-binding NarL/FixJ family response regulator
MSPPGIVQAGRTVVPETPAVSGRDPLQHSPSSHHSEHIANDATGFDRTGLTAARARLARHPGLRNTSILIVDDCTLNRENLAAVLELIGVRAPATAWDLPSLVEATGRVAPTIVLFNTAIRGSHLLLEAAKDMRRQMQVIALDASEDDEFDIVACVDAEVAGYHMRTDSLDDLLALMAEVVGGEPVRSPRVSAMLLRRISTLAPRKQHAVRELALTTREIQVLRMLELGLPNQDIATQLSISVHTVKNHVHNVLTKLGVSTRVEAAAISRTVRMDTRARPRTRQS